MVSKASNIHFVAAEEYAQNLEKMGENKKHICITGSPVIEIFNKIKPIPKTELFNNLGLKTAKPVILLTYHPVTIELNTTPLQQIKNVFDALSYFYIYYLKINIPHLRLPVYAEQASVLKPLALSETMQASYLYL